MTKKIDGDISPAGNLEQLKNQAKRLLKQARAENPHALTRLLRARIDNDDIKLSDAQTAIARENGAASWEELTRIIKSKPEVHKRDSTISINGIDQIWLDCLDTDEAEKFYGGILNLKKVGEIPGQMVFFDCGGTNLLLGKRDKARPNSILYFNTGDSEQSIQEAYNDLKRAGAKMGDSPHCIAKDWNGYDVWMAFFQDPSGNQLALKVNVPTK